MAKLSARFTPQQALIVRLCVGSSFGAALAYLMDIASAPPRHPAIWTAVATSTLLLSAFNLWADAGTLRSLSFIVWSLIATVLIVYLAWHQQAHALNMSFNPFFLNLSFLIYPLLFISHGLVTGGDLADRPLAPYAIYFDEAWKAGDNWPSP